MNADRAHAERPAPPAAEPQAPESQAADPQAAAPRVTAPEPAEHRPPPSGPRALLLRLLGSLFAGLGFVGAFLPILPTTPFLLLAAACYARSSPKLHARLLESRVFGPYLRQWRDDRSVPRTALRKAYGLVALSFALSTWLVDATWLRVLLATLGALLIHFLSRLPATDEPHVS